jgi:hypothetical protein
MNCSNCQQQVNEKEINFQDQQPLHVGYSSPTVVRCCSCRNVLCEKCYRSYGRFIFTCKNETCEETMKNMNILEKIT